MSSKMWIEIAAGGTAVPVRRVRVGARDAVMARKGYRGSSERDELLTSVLRTLEHRDQHAEADLFSMGGWQCV